MSAPPVPSNTQTTTISKMDPQLYKLLYGTPNAPGANLLADSAFQSGLWRGAHRGDENSLNQIFGVPVGGNRQDYMPDRGPAPGAMPFQQSTPQQVALNNQLDPSRAQQAGEKEVGSGQTPLAAACGGEISAFATGGWTEAQGKNRDRLQGLLDSGKKLNKAQQNRLNALNKQYDTYQTTQQQNAAKQPYSMADAAINRYNYYYDPNTGLSTNPYFNKGLDTLNNTKMPEQYEQATGLYTDAANKLMGMSNYQPSQVSEERIAPASMQAASMQGADMNAASMDSAKARSYTAKGPEQWNTGEAERYMNPYIETALNTQFDLMNQQFAPQMQALQMQQAANGAFGGARGAISERQQQQNQNMLMANMAAQGMNTAYNTGLGAFQNQNQLQQTNRQFNAGARQQGSQYNASNQQAANQANANWQQQANMNNQLYGVGGFNAQQQNANWLQQANQANAGWQQQANVQNAANNLAAQQSNQQAGLSANAQNLGAVNNAGNFGSGLIGAGNAQNAFNQQQIQNWGNAGTALQNVGQQYWNNQQQNAQNWWGGVNNSVAPAASMVSGQPWGRNSGTNYGSTPTTFKRGGKVRRARAH